MILQPDEKRINCDEQWIKVCKGSLQIGSKFNLSISANNINTKLQFCLLLCMDMKNSLPPCGKNMN
jgi:hypothetical protein